MTAIKCVALLILLLAIAVVAGIAGCRIMGVNAHPHEMIPACSLALVASIIAVVPILVRQGRTDTAGTFQLALIGSVLHLAIVLMSAMIMLLLKRVTTPFVLWLLAGYWATLIGLCVTFAKLIQTAPKVVNKGM